MEEIRRNGTSEVSGYWRVVKVDLENGNEFKNDELYVSREEAEVDREKCQQKWKENAWDDREYCTMEYQLRFMTREEVAEEKRKKLEAWRSYLRKAYLDPIEPATFTTCCAKLMIDMQKRVRKLSADDISMMRQDEKELYSPWQAYGGRAKLWACTHFEPGNQEVSIWGMFVLDSLFGSLKIRIKKFESIDDYIAWLDNTDESADAFEKRMLKVLRMEINGNEQV